MSRAEASGRGFWSRRRAAVAAEEAATEPPVEAAPDDRDDAEILAALGLPDPDSLRPGDDVAAFMARAVPAHLRRRALRRLWTSNPVLANVDSLVDYGGDFTDTGVKVGAVATVYEVGRGMLRHVERLAGDAREGVPVRGSEPVIAAENGAAMAAESLPEAEMAAPETVAPAVVLAAETAAEAEMPTREAFAPAAGAVAPRRMRFEFG